MTSFHTEVIQLIGLKQILCFLSVSKNTSLQEADSSLLARNPLRSREFFQTDYMDKKNAILKLIKSMTRLNFQASIICYLYRDYVKFCSKKILEDFYPECRKEDNILIKIGYYLMNMKSILYEREFDEEDFYLNIIKN